MNAYINETLNGTSLRETASFEPSCMFVRRSVRPLRDSEKKIQKKISNEKSHKVVIFHVCVGAPLSNRLQWKFGHRFRSPTLSIV
jgi:hypothetical protein